MKNVIILFILFLCYSISLTAQSSSFNKQETYRDALKLKEAVDKQDTTFILEILKKYKIDENIFKSEISLVDNLINDNIVLLNQNDNIVLLNQNDKSSSTQNKVSTDESTSELSLLNLESSAINSLANFMAGRFKQEVLHLAINDIFEQIVKDKKIVELLFPKTFEHINNLYDSKGTSYYSADLTLLRKTAQIDIEELPNTIIQKSAELISIANSSSTFSSLDKERMQDAITLGTTIVKYSQQGQSLDDLLSTLADKNYSSTTTNTIINILDLISKALLDSVGSKNIWVNPINTLSFTKLEDKGNDEIKLFYFLLYYQLKDIPEFKTFFDNSKNIKNFAENIKKLIAIANEFNNLYNYSKEFKLKSSKEFLVYIKEVNSSFHSSIGIMKDMKILSAENTNKIDSMINKSKTFIDIVEATIEKDYQRGVSLLLFEFSEYMKHNNQNNTKFLRTIVFLSQLASTANVEDMESILNSYALPIGSSSIKRQSSFNISVNSYVGLTGGFENAYYKNQNKNGSNFGLTAPIGVSATCWSGYFTIFLSLIDLGSIVNQRIFSADTTLYSGLKFEQFFSPAIGFFLNCPNTPLTCGFNLNFTPNLRKIKYEKGNAVITESNISVLRVNFSILIDIPLFTLHNKAK